MRCTRGSFACLSEPHALFLAAVCVRVAILLVGRLADALWEVRYTDVDYEVFTDGARFLASGGSPYDRATYRYPPVLALLLLPNLVLPEWGKALFCAADIVTGLLLARILEAGGASALSAARAAAAFTLNPIVINISTRGSGDALTVLAGVACLFALVQGRWAAAGMAHGLACHLRLFPLLHALPLSLWLLAPAPGDGREALAVGGASTKKSPAGVHTRSAASVAATAGGAASRISGGARGDGSGLCGGGEDEGGSVGEPAREGRGGARSARGGAWGDSLHSAARWLASTQWRRLAKFGCASLSVVLLMGAASAMACGPRYLERALLHHITRVDARHNFSPHFLPSLFALHHAAEKQEAAAAAASRAEAGEAAFLSAASAAVYAEWEAADGSEAAGPEMAGYEEAAAPGLAGATFRLLLAHPSLASLVPQLGLCIFLGVFYADDLPWALFAQTFAFVAWNRVITVQYAHWYAATLALVLPQSRLSPAAGAVLGAVWLAADLAWNWPAFYLELRAQAAYTWVWGASLAFFAVNAGVLATLLAHHQPRPWMPSGGRMKGA